MMQIQTSNGYIQLEPNDFNGTVALRLLNHGEHESRVIDTELTLDNLIILNKCIHKLIGSKKTIEKLEPIKRSDEQEQYHLVTAISDNVRFNAVIKGSIVQWLCDTNKIRAVVLQHSPVSKSEYELFLKAARSRDS